MIFARATQQVQHNVGAQLEELNAMAGDIGKPCAIRGSPRVAREGRRAPPWALGVSPFWNS
eukprot:7302354-Pyramimonas_sp.AAC.1